MATKFDLVKQGERIDKCSELLPNGFQCQRAGEFWVLKTLPLTEGQTEPEIVKERQVCRAHSIIIRAREQEEANGVSNNPNLSNNEILLERLNSETPAEQALKEKLTEQKGTNTNEQSNPESEPPAK